MAKLYGLDAALVFAYMNWRNENSGNLTITIDDLLKHYPYMGKRRLRSALGHLLNGHGDELPVFSRVQSRGMLHYTYRLVSKYNPDFNLPDDASHGARYCFEVEFAVNYGIIPAVIHHNLSHWIVENWKSQKTPGVERACHYITPRRWAERHHYLSVRTVERAFKVLTDAGEIVVCGRKGGRLPVWTLPKRTLDKLLDGQSEKFFPESPVEANMRESGTYNPVGDHDL